MNITLEALIQEHKERIKILRYHREAFIPYYDYENMEAYHLWVEKPNGIFVKIFQMILP